MTAWTTLLNSLFLVDKPITSPTGLALRDNPIAIADGAANSPVNAAAWHPYNRVLNGDSNTGLIYDFAVSGAVASVVTPNFVDGYEYRVRFFDVSQASSGALNLRMDLYLETDAIYNTAFTLVTSTGLTDLVSGEVEMLDVRRARRVQISKHTGVITSIGGGAGGTQNTFFCIRTAQKRLNARFYWSTGNIDAGQIFLDRRLAQY